MIDIFSCFYILENLPTQSIDIQTKFDILRYQNTYCSERISTDRDHQKEGDLETSYITGIEKILWKRKNVLTKYTEGVF